MLELARRGYVVLAPDYPSFGDYAYDFGTDRYSSGTMKGIFNEPIKGFGVLSDYARKHAALRTGIGGQAKFEGLDPSIHEQAAIFEEETRYLAQAADKILRKHGKGISGKQFDSDRLAEIMIDLFVMASTISTPPDRTGDRVRPMRSRA